MKNTHRGDTQSLIDWSESVTATATQTLQKLAVSPARGRRGAEMAGISGTAVQISTTSAPLTVTVRGNGRSQTTRTSSGVRERTRGSAKRRESDDLGPAVFENWPEAVFLLDPHDGRVIGPAVECNGVEWEIGGAKRRFAWALEWPILECNGAACRRHGYSRNELIGNPIGALGPLASEPDVLTNLLGELGTREIVRFEGLNRGRDGKYFPVETSAAQVRLGNRDLVLMVVRDFAPVSPEAPPAIQHEEQTRHLERWESIGRLAGGVAHDFTSVLSEIRRCAEVIQASPNANAELASQIKHLMMTAERATTLTWQILAFSRKHAALPELVDLNALVRDVVAMLQHVLNPDVEVDFRLASVLPAIPAHCTMLEQVLLNLAINSRYAMPRGGKLVIESRVADVDAAYVRQQPEAKIGRYVCLWMTDTGGGVNASRIGCIHEPFFTTRNMGQGTGLGLATVHGIIKQHQGWIDVGGAMGQGTRFTVYLPVNPAKLDPMAADRPQLPIAGGTESILLAEGDMLLRALARSILQRYGYQVIEAATAADALAKWEKHGAQIKLLLTDMGSTVGLNGRELARLLRGRNARLKVLFTSACSAAIAQADSPLRPGVTFLPKPYSATALAQATRNCLDHEHAQ